MYKDLGTVLLIGGCGTGKSVFIHKYIKEIINEENLTIPHKYVHLRAFTLVPMMELNSDFVHPVLHKTIEEMHNDLENPEMVFLYGTRVDF